MWLWMKFFFYLIPNIKNCVLLSFSFLHAAPQWEYDDLTEYVSKHLFQAII